ncbi:hypothetical protein LWF01_02325 [Saxibacter everestensis]|uniref:Flp family type IVb pilin n=1 Tax=Saxibacter everestensis TaxID=2909229 RepID=A0ABY8QW79_9MICO|nr:hypothetical protein LWF01_02325 [Brevibacteriaceae bacterium ZFBP1038]
MPQSLGVPTTAGAGNRVRRAWNRLRSSAGRARDRGASAIEWVIITAVLVVVVSIIGGVVYNVVQTKSSELEKCANQPVGSKGCGP